MENKNTWGGARKNAGGARQGAGRKKGTLNKGEHKTGRIVITCLESEETEIKQLAKNQGKTTTSFILECVRFYKENHAL